MGKPTIGFPTRSDINRAVQAQKMASDWKFWIYKVEDLYYPCSENKRADQLRGYREADLRLLFSHMQIVGFLMRRLIYQISRTKKFQEYITQTWLYIFS